MTTFYLYFVCLVKFLLMIAFYSFKKLKDLTNVLLLKTCSFLSKFMHFNKKVKSNKIITFKLVNIHFTCRSSDKVIKNK